MPLDLTDRQRAALTALCDTFVPAVRPPAVESHDPTGFWARTASDVGVPAMLVEELERRLGPDDQDDVRQLLDALAGLRFGRLPQAARETIVAGLERTGQEAREGIGGLRALTLYLHYGAVGPDGRNPSWTQTAHPGPPPSTSAARSTTTWRPPDGDDEVVLDADVVVVGSGSGGGVVAAVLAQAGLDVVVLEAGPDRQDDDFPPDEVSAFRDLYWRGGLTLTDDGNVAILAGATLGGGSTINWQNCVPPPDLVRQEWADAGLSDVATSAFDAHLEAVGGRIQVTDALDDLNGPNQRLVEGAKALGWSWQVTARNTTTDGYDPASAGFVGYGDRSGAKQGALKTWLPDAVEHGARVVADARAERVEVSGSRASGVVGHLTRPNGATRPLRVRARDVVVACGALETPALLLRSGIGGSAVGRHLRLHPVPMLLGVYTEDQRAWWGPPQGVVVDEHREAVAGHGYLVETAHSHPGVIGMSLPFRSARDHKLLMGRSAEMAGSIAVCRDHGQGRVALDADGQAEVTYPLDDDVDRAVIRHALRSLVELHVAAGARAIVDLSPRRDLWRRTDDVDDYVERIGDRPLGNGGRVLFCAHQMGSARMGTDPETSVCAPDGRLHDVAGVWVGDTSVFPTAVGSNPMLTCMAMARRTAMALLASRPT